MNITDDLGPYFEGKVSWEKAASEAFELFLKAFESATFICESCGEIIFPKVTTNEHGIFIESSQTEVRGARNRVVKKNICDNCCDVIRCSGYVD